MASAEVVETSVTNNSPSQNSYHPDDLFQSRYATPGLKPFCYYTSVALFEELEDRKTLACDTVRSNKAGLPKEICGLKEKCVKELERRES